MNTNGKQKNEIMEQVSINKILIGVFINLHKLGNSEIPLNPNYLNDNVSKLDYIFRELNLKTETDVFIKTPVDETYDEFRFFLINELYGNRLGEFNNKYDSLTITCNEYKTNKILKSLEQYKELIDLCSYILLNDVEIQNIKIKKRT